MLQLLGILLICFICQCEGEVVKGKINLKWSDAKSDGTIKTGSFATVKVEDTSIADVASTVLGETTFALNKIAPPFDYEVTYNKPDNCLNATSLSLSVVVNNGWEPTEDEWIRTNDFLTTTNSPFKCEAEQNLTADFYD